MMSRRYSHTKRIVRSPMSKYHKEQLMAEGKSVHMIYLILRDHLQKFDSLDALDDKIEDFRSSRQILFQWSRSVRMALKEVYEWVSSSYLTSHRSQAKSAHTLLYLLDYYKGRYEQFINQRSNQYVKNRDDIDTIQLLVDGYIYDFYEVADKFRDVIDILLSDETHKIKRMLLRPYWTSFERWNLITFDEYLENCREVIKDMAKERLGFQEAKEQGIKRDGEDIS